MMEDPRWLRLITIGLVLVAIAVGYFLFTSRSSSTVSKTASQISKASPGSSPSASASPTVLGQNTKASSSPAPSATQMSAYNRIANRTQAQAQALPSTGFPAGLIAIISISVMVSGWGLRRFPH